MESATTLGVFSVAVQHNKAPTEKRKVGKYFGHSGKMRPANAFRDAL